VCFSMICLTDTAMKATVVGVMLCLIFALVEVHSQTVPYIRFRGKYLPNHTYVDFNPVSVFAKTTIQCHTDLTTCCSSSEGPDRGDWYFPNGTRLPLPPTDGRGIIYLVRSNMVVQVRRLRYSAKVSGIYRCDIETNTTRNDHRESVYAGLYFSGGQFMQTCINADITPHVYLIDLICQLCSINFAHVLTVTIA